MKPYFKTTMEIEELSKDDILILEKWFRGYNLIIKIVKYILLVVTILFVFLFLPSTYNVSLDIFIAKYYFEVGSLLFFIAFLASIFGMVCIYFRFIIDQALKNNYVAVCTGVITEEYFIRGFTIFIGTIRLSIEGNIKKKLLKIGTCVQCRFVETHSKSYCISIKRHDQIMYDPEHILQVEEKDLDLDTDIWMKFAMLEEIVNSQMLQIKMGKKNGIKGILLAIILKVMNPLYKVKYDKGEDDNATMPDFKGKLNNEE